MSRKKRDSDLANEPLWRAAGPAQKRLASKVTPEGDRTEHVGVLRNRRTGDYIVEPMARHPIGASAIFGTPVTIPVERFESEITEAILENLGKYHIQVFREESAPRKKSSEEQKAFLETHLSISVTRYPNGDVWIYPMRRDRGGYAATGEKIMVPAAETHERLASAVREAFSKGG